MPNAVNANSALNWLRSCLRSSLVANCFVVLLGGISLAGCSIHQTYEWEEHPINPAEVHLRDNESSFPTSFVEIKAGASESSTIVLGHVQGTGRYWDGSLQTLTNAVVRQLVSELDDRNYISPNKSDKTAEVRVTKYTLDNGMFVNGHYLIVELKLGNGRVKKLRTEVYDSTTRPARIADLVVSQAVITILNDKDFSSYLATIEQ